MSGMKARKGSRTTTLTLSRGEAQSLISVLRDYAERRRKDTPARDDDLHRAIIEGEAGYAERVANVLIGDDDS